MGCLLDSRQNTRARRLKALTLGREAQDLLSFIQRNVSAASIKHLEGSVLSRPDMSIDSLKTHLELVAMHVTVKTGRTPSGKVVRKEQGEIVLYSKDGSKVLGSFPFGHGKRFKNEQTAREAAARRERQIAFFKNRKKSLWPIESVKKVDPELAEVMRQLNVPALALHEFPMHLRARRDAR